MQKIEYWRRQYHEVQRGLYEAMVEELPIGCRIVYQERDDEATAEVIEHSEDGLCLGVRDERGNEFWVDLDRVTGRE